MQQWRITNCMINKFLVIPAVTPDPTQDVGGAINSGVVSRAVRPLKSVVYDVLTYFSSS
jgi:hypothetical protein